MSVDMIALIVSIIAFVVAVLTFLYMERDNNR